MPTGYTGCLFCDGKQEKKVKDWIIENLTRAFGMCVMLRDENNDISKDKILEKIGKKSDYHSDRIKEIEEEIKEKEKWKKEDWIKKINKVNKEIRKRNQESILKASNNKRIWIKATRILLKVIDKTDDDITKNICNFGIEQLKLTEGDNKPYLSDKVTEDWKEYRDNAFEGFREDLKYHNENKEEDDEREDGRVDAYKKVVSEVERILG